ncbi:hypothetical protein ACWF82_19420 [Nocardia sp. NPDC055053]
MADPLDALFLHAATAILDRQQHDQATLRAMGVALRSSTAHDDTLRMTADDVEIVDGSTESSNDVGDAGRRTTLFEPEVALAAEIAGRGPIRVLVDTDQQLPAAIAIALGSGSKRIELCGRFAFAHRATLSRLPELRGATVSSWIPRWQLAGEWSDGEPVTVVADPADRREGEPWIGWLDVASLLEVPTSGWPLCRGLILTAAARPGHTQFISGASGMAVDIAGVVGQMSSGIPVRVELLVGAPGVEYDSIRETAHGLADDNELCLAGLRPFRLGVDTRGSWGGRQLIRRPQPTDRDLPRSQDFDAAETIEPQKISAVIADLLAGLSPRTELLPGRFAATVPMTATGQDGWSANAQVVRNDGPGPDGRGPGHFVVNLASGSAFRLHPRLAPVVDRLARGDRSVAQRLSDRVRDRLSGQLAGAGVWRGSL